MDDTDMIQASRRTYLTAVLAIGLCFPSAAASLAASSTSIDSTAPSSGLLSAARVASSQVFCGERDPVQLGYDSFYQQHCSARGLDVLASPSVDPAAVRRTAEIIVDMIGHRPDIVEAMINQGVRVAVIGTDEVTSDMPEYRNIYELFPGVDWDTRARGLGATPTIPLSSVGEENILCLPTDSYVGSSIMVHEFAHTILGMGLRFAHPDFNRNDQTDPVVRAFDHALSTGLWPNTYAITLPDEYWAEAVMSYFDTNINGPVGGDGIHNNIDTKIELASYDPQIYAVIDDIFGGAAPLGLCNG